MWQDPQPNVQIAGWQTPASEDSVELFDLRADPREKNNLVEKYPERAAAMKDRLDAWWSPELN